MTQNLKASLAVAMMSAVVGLTVAGCGSSSNGAPMPGAATTHAAPTETADPSAGLWDPCNGIPTGVLSSNAVDPVPPKMGQGLPIRGWKTCTWMADWFGLTVYSTHHKIDELTQSDSYAGVQPVTIGDRAGILQHGSGSDFSTECVVALPAEQGMVEVAVERVGASSDTTPRDLCAKAKDLTAAFLPYLPK